MVKCYIILDREQLKCYLRFLTKKVIEEVTIRMY